MGVRESGRGEANCNVLVERIGTEGAIDSILLPTAGGPHARYAAEVANAIAHSTGASITLLRVTSVDDNQKRELATASLDDLESILTDAHIERELIESDDVAEAIVEASGDHVVTIIGATREGLLQQLVFGAIPETVGREANGTVIMAKQDRGITSRFRRLFSRS